MDPKHDISTAITGKSPDLNSVIMNGINLGFNTFTTTEAPEKNRGRRDHEETTDPHQKMPHKEPLCSPFPLCLCGLQSPLMMEFPNPG